MTRGSDGDGPATADGPGQPADDDGPAEAAPSAGPPGAGTSALPAADAGTIAAPAEAESSVAPSATPVSMFSLDGRAAPALYLVGWVGALIGGATLVVSLLAGADGAAPWLFLAGLLVLGVGLVAAAGSQAIERARRPGLAYRGPSPVLVFLVVVAFTPLVQVAVLAPLSMLGLDPRSPGATTVNLALQVLLYAAALRLLVVGPGSLSWAEMRVVRPDAGALRDLLVGGLLAVPVLVVTLLIGGVLSRFLQPAPNPLPEPGGLPGLVANLLTAAVLAPIGEELFFRGFTTTAWARAVGARPAIVRGAVFFALVHVLTLLDATFAAGAQRALYSFLALLPVALTLGWLFLARRSLYAAIGLHATFNGLQLVLLALATGIR